MSDINIDKVIEQYNKENEAKEKLIAMILERKQAITKRYNEQPLSIRWSNEEVYKYKKELIEDPEIVHLQKELEKLYQFSTTILISADPNILDTFMKGEKK